MLREKRHALSLNWMRQDRLVSVAELSQRLEVSYLIHFLDQPNLTVLTNGLHTSQLLYNLKHQDPQRNLTAMCSGGILIETRAFTDPSPLYSNLKRVMKGNAERVIMLVDSSKFGVRSLGQVMGLDEVNLLVTDPGAPEEIVAGLRQVGSDVRQAEPFATAQDLT